MTSHDRRLNSPQSVLRVIQLLEALAASEKPVGLADLSRDLGSPKSSLAALLRGLCEAGIVVAVDGAYRLGAGAFGLASALMEARRRIHSSDLVREGMRALVARSGETVLFAVRDGDGETLTYVDVAESRNAVRFAVSVGDRRPLYCTAAGRMLLAVGDDEATKRYLAALKPGKRAAATETRRRQLADAIVEAREKGVAHTVDQAAEGVTGFAAPVRGADGQVDGVLVIAAPTVRAAGQEAALAEMVRREAATISRNLGFRGAAPPPATA